MSVLEIIFTVNQIFLLLAARLMHKYNAHGATDVTGFGLLGHAQNLARNQKAEVSFVIHNLPVIAKMTAVAKACGNMFQLLQGLSAETSGKFLMDNYIDACYVSVATTSQVIFSLCRGSSYLPSKRASCSVL